MARPKVAVIVGSLRKGSFNRQLARAVEKLADDALELVPVGIGGLPLYDQDDDENLPAASARFKQAIESADALLFVTPEYNRSIPGVLKNAIDIGTRPAGKNSFAGKRAAVIGASPGAHGTVSAQQHLRNVLSAVGLAVLPQPEIAIQYKEGLIDENGEIADERTRKFLLGFVRTFADWLA
ncbi:MAG: NADPH-dependent FMN reductase [Pseudoxanthomonas sp.]